MAKFPGTVGVGRSDARFWKTPDHNEQCEYDDLKEYSHKNQIVAGVHQSRSCFPAPPLLNRKRQDIK